MAMVIVGLNLRRGGWLVALATRLRRSPPAPTIDLQAGKRGPPRDTAGDGARGAQPAREESHVDPANRAPGRQLRRLEACLRQRSRRPGALGGPQVPRPAPGR